MTAQEPQDQINLEAIYYDEVRKLIEESRELLNKRVKERLEKLGVEVK